MSENSVTLFQFENGMGPAKALLAAGIDAALGEGIRASYGIVGIKAGKFRIKYKGVEEVVSQLNPNTGQREPVSSIQVVIVKANPFLNKQYYAGKYTEGSNSAPDCYSLDGKVPSPSIPKPVFSNCTLCPKNLYGSMVSETGIKQKACRDTKKLAIVPLENLRNEALGGPMLFRVPPSSLKDLSALADGMKARGYPYNSVAVRIGFDLEASHPKPTFKAIRPLTDEEAEVVLELFHGDGVAAVLSDNDAVVDAVVAPVEKHSEFEQEPVKPAGLGSGAVPAGTSVVPDTAPTRFVAPPVAVPPPGMQSVAVEPFIAPAKAAPAPAGSGAGLPPASNAVNPFSAPRPVGRPRKVPVDLGTIETNAKPSPVQEPAFVEPTPEPTGSSMESDIDSILMGLNAFTSNGK